MSIQPSRALRRCALGSAATIPRSRRRLDGRPLPALGHDVWLSELSQGAYGYLEDSGWSELLPEGPVTGPRGAIRRTWAKGFAAAVERLAEAGTAAGPESDPARWASWLAFELAGLHDLVRARAAATDAER